MPPDFESCYLKEMDAKLRPICEKLRDVVLKASPQLVESIQPGGSSYRGKGLVCAIGAFQKHVTLFFFRGVELADPDGLFTDGEGNAEWRIAKFATLSEVKTKLLTALVKAAVKLDAEVARPARRKRPELPVPPVLAEALRGDPRAKKFFESLPPSSRREYSEWIADAKQESTIQRRLEKAMILLGEGMRLSESYK